MTATHLFAVSKLNLSTLFTDLYVSVFLLFSLKDLKHLNWELLLFPMLAWYPLVWEDVFIIQKYTIVLFCFVFLPLAVINGYGCDSDKEPHKQNECLIAKYFKQMIDKALTLTEAYNAPSLSRCARSTKQMFASWFSIKISAVFLCIADMMEVHCRIRVAQHVWGLCSFALRLKR